MSDYGSIQKNMYSNWTKDPVTGCLVNPYGLSPQSTMDLPGSPMHVGLPCVPPAPILPGEKEYFEHFKNHLEQHSAHPDPVLEKHQTRTYSEHPSGYPNETATSTSHEKEFWGETGPRTLESKLDDIIAKLNYIQDKRKELGI